MPKKPKKMRTFARTATKSQEKKLIENAKQLQKNPFVVIPDCSDKACEKYFSKVVKRIEKVKSFKEDTDKLEKYANKKGIEAALAGTLLLAISEKAPYLGVLPFPTGDITFAQRGKASKEKLVGFQHFDDPVLRILAVKDIAYKKKLHIYSWDNGFVCSGKTPQPPQAFIDFIIQKLHLNCKNLVCTCSHLEKEKVKEKQLLKTYYLRIFWKSAGLIIGLCTDCARSTKNTMFTISKYMVTTDISDDFEIDVIAEVIHQSEKDSLQKTEYINEYLSGNLTDSELITKNIKTRKEKITQSDEKILVYNEISYGSDVQGFMDVIKPKAYEKDALEYVLEQIDEPLVLKDTTANKILEMYWKKHGYDFLKSIIKDKKMAESFFKLDETPSTILKTVYEYKNRQDILIQLPQFSALPPLASYADMIARTYRTFGQKKALSEIKKHPDTPKGKSIAYAFLLSLKQEKDVQWKYSKEEIEYGEYLKTYAKKLLEIEPKKYAETLQLLLTASGSNEKVQ
jgi:hypothetical protein